MTQQAGPVPGMKMPILTVWRIWLKTRSVRELQELREGENSLGQLIRSATGAYALSVAHKELQ